VINQIRGLLLERGITVRKGRAHIEASLLAILEDAYNKLSGILRVLLAQMQLEMQYLRRQIDESDKVILEIAKGMDSCRRLIVIPGNGPLTATATIAAIGNGAAFATDDFVLRGWCYLGPVALSTAVTALLSHVSREVASP
jgi:transposase